MTSQRLLNSLPLLNEAGIRDFHYEIGWGKMEALASAQTSGTAIAYDLIYLSAVLDPPLDFVSIHGYTKFHE